MRRFFKNIVSMSIGCIAAMAVLTGCGKLTSDTITVKENGDYAFAAIGESDYYVVRFFKEEDVNADGTIKEDVRPVLKQTLQAAAGTSGNFKKISKLAFGSYYPTIYGLNMDKSTTETVVGDKLVIGGTLSAPQIVVQNDYGKIKVAITDKSFDEFYFNKEALYSFTVQVFDNEKCSGSPVAEQVFGQDAEYIAPTNSSKAVWIRNQYTEVEVADGNYYVRVKANGSAEAQVKDSAWTEAVAVTSNSAETEVKYVTGTFDPKAGSCIMDETNLLEFGNGAAMFTSFEITDDPETVKEGDLYTLNGPANCDLHIMGNVGDTEGEIYTCGPRLMPIDKPDIRGTWKLNDDGTISVTFMADYQYYIDEADKKTT